MDIPSDIFSQYPRPRYQVQNFDITWDLISLQEEYSNRLARHVRLYRDKERLDDTGGASRIWTMVGEFYNGGQNGQKYPEDMDRLIEGSKIHEIGRLTVPTVGPVQARLANYKRLEQVGERDVAMLTMVWVEDGADDESASRWQAPQASAIAPRLVADAINAFAKKGVMLDPFGQISDLCDSLSELAQAPFDFVDTWQARAAKVVNALDRVGENYTVRPASRIQNDVSTLMSGPDAARGQLLLRKTANVISDAAAAHRAPTIITRMFDQQLSIFAIAQQVKQDFVTLMTLNNSLTLLAIPAGTPVKMYADGTARSF